MDRKTLEYMENKDLGRNEEKEAILEQLEHVKNTTTNESVGLIIGTTIEFLKKQG